RSHRRGRRSCRRTCRDRCSGEWDERITSGTFCRNTRTMSFSCAPSCNPIPGSTPTGQRQSVTCPPKRDGFQLEENARFVAPQPQRVCKLDRGEVTDRAMRAVLVVSRGQSFELRASIKQVRE